VSYPPGQAGPRKRSNVVPIVAAVIAGVLLIVGIRWFTTRGDDSTSGSGPTTTATGAPPPRDGCTRVTVAASSEKAALLQQMAQTYHSSGRTVDGKCFDVQVNSVASGTAEANLAQG
jgi:Ca-activated chloride channel family protein